MKHIKYYLPVIHLVLLTLLLCLAQPLASAQVIYSYGFESGPQGWSEDNGVWTIGIPTVGPDSPHSGTQCAFTTGPGGNYPANVSSRLISPKIILPSISSGQQIVLTFWQWFFWDQDTTFASPGYGDVQVSTQGPTGPWTTVSNPASGNSPYNGSSPAWSLARVDLSAYAGQPIWIGFQHVGRTNPAPGWYIDDVTVSAQVIPYLSLNQTVGFENSSSIDWSTNWQGWSADNGIWNIGAPTAGPGAPFDGSQSAGTVLAGAPASATGSYPTNTASRLISPPINLPAIASGQQITLTFSQWFFWDQDTTFASPGYGDVQVSTWNSTTSTWNAWTTVSNPASGNSAYNGSSPAWSLASVDLSAYAGKQIQIGFLHVGKTNPAPGWYVDDVSVNKVTIQSLPFSETFENFSATDWVGWSADNGIWNVGAPTAGPGAAFDGVQSAGTVLEGSPSSRTGAYPTNTASRLISPPINLPAIASGQQITLTFSQWFFWDQDTTFASPGYGDVQVSTWNSTTSTWNAWTTVSNPASGNSAYNGSSPAWSLASVDLSAYAGKQIQIGFLHVGRTNPALGWYVDDVNVVLQPVPYMPLNQTITFGNFTPTNWQGWSADNGIWNVGAPTKGPGAPYNGDTQSAGTVLAGAPASATGSYPTNTASRLISPPINLPAIASGQQITLTFFQWFFWDQDTTFATPGSGNVEVSTWNSTTSTWNAWTPPLATYKGNSGGWGGFPASLDLSAYAGQLIQVGFQQVGGTNPDPGWYIDDVEVTTPPTALGVSGITFSPAMLCPNMTTTGTVTLTAVASSSATVTLTSSNPAALQVPASMTVSAGSSSGTFQATASSVKTNTNVTVTATLNGTSVKTIVTVIPWVHSVTILPNTVAGGAGATGFVTLNCPAPQGGIVVTLSSSNSAVTVPSSVTVPAGETTLAFTITTTAVTGAETAVITAKNGGASSTAKLTVLPAMIGSFVIVPSTVVGGDNAIGLITLTTAPVADTTVTLASSDTTDISFPSSVVIPAGSTTVTFNINTNLVTSAKTVTITADLYGRKTSAKLKINP